MYIDMGGFLSLYKEYDVIDVPSCVLPNLTFSWREQTANK